tara:strand:- start:12107 stop:12835 length:729 start_codon:yes stop_codon:yes gene_type:complete
MNDLKGKLAIVTGAGRGIGRYLASALHDEGVVVHGLDLDFPDEYYPFSTLKIDLTDELAYPAMIEYLNKYNDCLDILVNNAGITLPSKSCEYSLEDWEKTFKINVTVPFQVVQSLLPLLKKSENASVINITSLNAALAFPHNPAYVASKSALAGLTRSMALDYGEYGIRVNAVAPGYIKTDMTGESWTNVEKREKRAQRTVLNRWGTPQDLVGPMLFLASEMSKYVTGHSLYVDGGWKIKGL